MGKFFLNYSHPVKGDKPTLVRPGMVVHTCNPVLGKLKQEDHKFKASLGYIVRSSLKNKETKAILVSTDEAEFKSTVSFV
jgi:hypothetical protein